MYCKNCKSFFSEAIVTDRDPETGEYDVRCPNCGDDYIIDSHECPCGTEISEEHDFCEDCYEQVKSTLNKLKDDLNFDQDSFEQIISNHFGW